MDVDCIANILFYHCAFKDVSTTRAYPESYSPLVDHLLTPVNLTQAFLSPAGYLSFSKLRSIPAPKTQGFPRLRESCTSTTATVLVPPSVGHWLQWSLHLDLGCGWRKHPVESFVMLNILRQRALRYIQALRWKSPSITLLKWSLWLHIMWVDCTLDAMECIPVELQLIQFVSSHSFHLWTEKYRSHVSTLNCFHSLLLFFTCHTRFSCTEQQRHLFWKTAVCFTLLQKQNN